MTNNSSKKDDIESLDYERHFRKRALWAICFVLGFASILRGTQELLAANWELAFLTILSASFIFYLSYQIRRDTLRSAGNTIALWLMFFVPAFSLAQGSTALGFIIGAPALLSVICITATKAYTVLTTIFMSAAVLILIISNDSGLAITAGHVDRYGVTIFLSMIVMSLALYTYSRASIKSRDAIKTLLFREKESLAQQRTTNNALITTQRITLSTAWWYDIKTKQLSFVAQDSSGKNGKVETIIVDDQLLAQTASEKSQIALWLPDFCSIIKKGADAGWDREITCYNRDGDVVHYRSLGDSNADSDQKLHGVYQDITESKALKKRINENQIYDAATGLLRRNEFIKRFERGNQEIIGKDYYYIVIDVDHFKVVNDTYSYAAGDRLIENAANMIRDNLFATDMASRIGADKIAIITKRKNQSEAEAFADFLRVNFSISKVTFDNHELTNTISVGLVHISKQLNSYELLDQLADLAVADAKKMGRNRVVIRSHDDGGLQAHQNQTSWLGRFNDALNENRLALYAQAVVPGKPDPTERPRYELLVRMLDEDYNIVPPDTFLPVVERYGLSTALDLWVVKTAIELCKNNGCKMSVWVNLSGESLSDNDFCKELIARVAEANLPKHTINFEITETAVVKHLETAIDLMNQLKTIGCRFALDDFGTGQASFAYLKELPIDVVKIDGYFIKQIAHNQFDAKFTATMIQLAHSIGAATVAECVEDEKSVNILMDLKADYLQGYHLHRPCPVTEIPAFSVAS